jgi:hypothetical protein
VNARVYAPHDGAARYGHQAVWNVHDKLNAATERQLEFLEKLRAERVVSADLEADIAFELEQPHGATKRGVSALIDDLMAAPKKVAFISGPTQKKDLPDVPAGYYAVEGRDGVLRFLKVDRPDEGPWAGWTFVKVQAGDDFHRLKGDQPRKALEAIVAYGAKEASIRYGKEIGACGVCGRTLTDETSRANGIGPVCAQKMGW